MMFIDLAAARLARARDDPTVADRHHAAIAKRSQPRFVAQWRHTGTLNGQIEEAYTGPRAGEGVRAAARDRGRRSRRERRALPTPRFGAQFICGIIMPAMMFIGNLDLRRHRCDRRPAGGVRCDLPGRRPGLHPVLAAVHPAAHADRVHGQPAAVRRRIGRAGLRAAGRSRSRWRTRSMHRRCRDRRRAGDVRARVVQLRPGRRR